LELELFTEEINLAIEIQGLQHFVDLYFNERQHMALKANDIFKKITCKEKGVKLIWMDWEGVNKCLMRTPREERIEVMKNLVEGFTKSSHNFLMWRNTVEVTFE